MNQSTDNKTNRSSKPNKDKKYSKGKPKDKGKTGYNAFHLRNTVKKKKNFMYQNAAGGKCHRCDFSESNFDYANFRGASMKDCNFKSCSFKGTEFVGTNFKDSDFSNATFENCIFDGTKLVGVNFKGAKFINTKIIFTDLTVAKNIDKENEGITIYEEMPMLDISVDLLEAMHDAMVNDYVKKSRVLDTKEGKVHYVSIIRLLEHFDEATLTKGLKAMLSHLERDFYTLSFLVTLIKKLEKSDLL